MGEQKGLIVIKTDRQKDRLTGLMGKEQLTNVMVA